MGLFSDSLDDSRLSDQSGKEEASHTSDLLLYKRLADRQPADSRVRQTSYWRRPTQFILSGSAGGSVCALVHAEAPRCFSFLVVQRATRGSRLAIRFWDTLPHPNLYKAARAALKLILKPAGAESQPLPAAASKSFSGLWAVCFLEDVWRTWEGEAPQGTDQATSKKTGTQLWPMAAVSAMEPR